MDSLKRAVSIFFLIVSLLLSGCVYHAAISEEKTNRIFTAVNRGDDPVARFAPVFLTYDQRNSYNLIGRPTAEYDGSGGEAIHVDINKPEIYYRVCRFETTKGIYTNYIYRVHFPEVPFRMFPFHLTAGKNVGIMVFITMNEDKCPVLVTTVHTCGCYVSVVPTNYLPPEAFPQDWKDGELEVYGETLPGILRYGKKIDPRLLVYLRPGVHRVMDLEIVESKIIHDSPGFETSDMQLKSMGELDRIPINGNTTSFYHKKGILKGHVKGSIKYWESLLMSVISLDLFVGMDKAYEDTDITENPFYTSLKIWNRNASNMWYFERFLEFRGWRL